MSKLFTMARQAGRWPQHDGPGCRHAGNGLHRMAAQRHSVSPRPALADAESAQQHGSN